MSEKTIAMTRSGLEPLASKALLFLHGEATRHGTERAQAEHLDDFLKVILAQLKGRMVGSLSDAQKTQMALEHPDYITALEARKIAQEQHYTNQYKREAASAFIEAYRTVCSNERHSA